MQDEQTDRDNANEKELPRMNDKLRPEDKSPSDSPAPEAGTTGTSAETGDIEGEVEKLRKQLAESEKSVGTYKDQLLRLAAEFDNFRKRTESDKADFIKFSNERIIRDLLPVLDDFERALSNGRKGTDYDSFFKGVEMIYQKLRKIFEEKGLKPIESVGKEFDVMYHDVLMQVDRPDAPPHTVVEEVERGYTLHGKVIKHAKVIVAADAKEENGTESAD